MGLCAPAQDGAEAGPKRSEITKNGARQLPDGRRWGPLCAWAESPQAMCGLPFCHVLTDFCQNGVCWPGPKTAQYHLKRGPAAPRRVGCPGSWTKSTLAMLGLPWYPSIQYGLGWAHIPPRKLKPKGCHIPRFAIPRALFPHWNPLFWWFPPLRMPQTHR